VPVSETSSAASSPISERFLSTRIK
jgi:hypothetical protein